VNDRQRNQAQRLLAAHAGREPLILPNAWDVVSAKIVELEGFPAVATTSAGIAATLGHADGERMSLAQNLAVVARIVGHVQVPVTADIETGYSTSVEGVVEAARGVLRAGAVGLNLEDGTGDPAAPLFSPQAQVEKLRAVRAMADGEECHLVINARTDVYFVAPDDPAARLRAAIERGNAYRAAGADCIFVPDVGGLDAAAIATLVREIDGPINVIAGVHLPPIPALADLGVRRVSLGPRPMRAAYSFFREIARELRDRGTYEGLSRATITYAEMNGWFGDTNSG